MAGVLLAFGAGLAAGTAAAFVAAPRRESTTGTVTLLEMAEELGVDLTAIEEAVEEELGSS